jgi:hypothetical protein
MRDYRPASGRYPLGQSFNPDYIPPGISYRPSLLPSLHKEPDIRPRDVRSTFNSETGELTIHLNFAEPEKEKPAINSAILYAKRQGALRRIVIFVASEIYGTTASFQFFRKNKFTRHEGRGYGDFLALVKEVGGDSGDNN